MDISNLQKLGEESFKIEDIFEDHVRGLIKDLVKGEANKRKIEDNTYEWVEREVWDRYAKSPIDISGCEDRYDIEDRAKEWIVNNVKLPPKTYNKLVKTIDDLEEAVNESRRYRGRMLNEDFGEDEGIGERSMIRDYMKKSLTDFEKLVEYVELRFGISFYGDLDQADAIDDYKSMNGRDLDYMISSVDDKDGTPMVTVTVGHSVGKRGDEAFMYVVEPAEGEPVYEEGISNWREAAKKTVAAVKKYMNLGVNESRRVHGRPLFEDIEVAEPKANPFKVGDILAGTWGYSMTIPMFVQVIGVTPKSVRCRKLRTLNDNGFQGHDAMAQKDDFVGAPFIARVRQGYDGKPYIYAQNCHLELWDGRGLYYDHMD